MERRDNYAAQSASARRIFCTYDQQALIRKLGLEQDESWIYTHFFDKPYRIRRSDGFLERKEGDIWQEANSFHEVMTLLDLVCDSREDRFLAGRWKNMTDFGLQFHRALMENGTDPFAQAIQDRPEAFCAACRELGGRPLTGADIGWEIPVFQELSIALLFWAGDEEFDSRVRFLWDENALMYLKYETMYFAVGFLKDRLGKEMEESKENDHAFP